MPQGARSPTRPVSAAQRGGEWSVPRIRQVCDVTLTASPSGTRPPADSSSSAAKSTRKLAQQAPQLRQSGTGSASPVEAVPSREAGVAGPVGGGVFIANTGYPGYLMRNVSKTVTYVRLKVSF